MNCEDVRELLPAYVLGALDREELEAVEVHLRTGREHDDELVELRATVFALDRFVEEQDLSVPQAAPRQPLKLPSSGLLGRISAAPYWGAVAAAVVLLAVFAAGWFVADLTRGGGGQEVSLLLQGPKGELLSLNGHTSRESVKVTMAGLARLSNDRAYQLWAVRDGNWQQIGLCNTNAEGGWKGEFAFRVREGERIALTVEPATGSLTPSSEPILISSS